MNRFLLAILLLPAAVRAQSPMFGLFGAHCLQAANDGSIRRLNKRVAIIYNQEYCWYYTPNGDVVSFKTRSYTKDLNASAKSIHESFVNQESQTTVDAFYHIMVDQTNEGTTFQVSTPTGTIVVQNAERFSENGQVKSGAMKIDWAAVRAGERRSDSVMAYRRQAEQRRQDSLASERHADARLHDSLLLVAKRMKIFIGRSDPDNHWLLSVINTRKIDSANAAVKGH